MLSEGNASHYSCFEVLALPGIIMQKIFILTATFGCNMVCYIFCNHGSFIDSKSTFNRSSSFWSSSRFCP